LPTVLEDVPDMAVKFAVYETMRNVHARLNGGRSANVAEDLIMGGVAGAAAAAATTPLDVVKTVMMCSASSRPTIVSAAAGIMKEGRGLAPFFRGVGPRALSNGLNSAIFFCFFEAIRQVGGACHERGGSAADRNSLLLGGCRPRAVRSKLVAWSPLCCRLTPACPLGARQVLIKKQQERLQPLQQQRRVQLKHAAAPQHGLVAAPELQPAASAARRPQGSPAACLTLALPAPGWRRQ
jgi:hypothetical protein